MSASLPFSSLVPSLNAVLRRHPQLHRHGHGHPHVHMYMHTHMHMHMLFPFIPAAAASLSSSTHCPCLHHRHLHLHPPQVHLHHTSPPIPPFPSPPTSCIPRSRPLSFSTPHLSPPSSRRGHQPKTETRPLSDASRAHLLSSSTSTSPSSPSALTKDGDWLCSKCHFLNFASRTSCWRCAHMPSPAQRHPIRTSRVEPVVIGLRPATVLGKQVVLVFVDMPLTAHKAEPGDHDHHRHAWTSCSHSTQPETEVGGHNHLQDHLHLRTESQVPIANLTDDLFQSLKLSPSPLSLTLEHAHATRSLALLTGDWICPSCSVVNYAFRDHCFKCDHDALDTTAPGRRLVILPRAMMLETQPLDSQSILVALAKIQGLWQGSLALGKSRVGPLWACTNCLYVNRSGAASCRKCGHDRDGWSRKVHGLALDHPEPGRQAEQPLQQQQQQQPGYVWVDRGEAYRQQRGEEAYGEDEGQDLVPKLDLQGRDKARDRAAVARANRGWKRREGKEQHGEEDEWDCD